MSIGKEVASEHLRDGSDNINECVKTIKRVSKSFPDLAPHLTKAVEHLGQAKASIDSAGKELGPVG